MNNGNILGWNKVTSNQHVKNKLSIKKPPSKLIDNSFNPNSASNMFFPYSWNVWIHKNSSSDWSISGYDNIMTIKSVADFWLFANAFNKLNYMDYQFFIMRENIKPIWESPENRNGGSAIIRLRLSDKNLLNIWEDICLYTINNQICSSSISDINGISFNLKNDLTVIKIWNNNGAIDISKKISKQLIQKYKLHAIVYTRNRPEF